MFQYAGSYRGGRRNFKGSKKQNSLPNAHLRSEIKDMDQIRKERQQKTNRMSYIKSKSPKGKKSGRNGKKGNRGSLRPQKRN